MLMNRLRDMYREVTGYIEPVTAITTVLNHGMAANADKFRQSDKQARRQRRQRRTERQGLRNISGWTVSSW
jgi:hypothetical protein